MLLIAMLLSTSSIMTVEEQVVFGLAQLRASQFVLASESFAAAMSAHAAANASGALLVVEDAEVGETHRTPVLMLHGVALLSLAREVGKALDGSETPHASALRTSALISLTAAARVTPLEAHVISNLGLAHERCSSFAAAERLYARAVALQPTIGMSHFNLANMLLLKKAHSGVEAATAAFAESADPVDLANVARWGSPGGPSLAFLAPPPPPLGALSSKRVERRTMIASSSPAAIDALSHYARAAMLLPTSAAVHENFGLALKRLAEDASLWIKGDAAAAAARAALRTIRGDRVESRGDMLRWACDALRRAIAIAPGKKGAIYTLGLALLALGGDEEVDDAIGQLRRALAMTPTDVDVLADLAVALHTRGDGIGEAAGSAAERLWAEALALNPNVPQPQTHYNRGRTLHNSHAAYSMALRECSPDQRCEEDPALRHFREAQRDSFRKLTHVALITSAAEEKKDTDGASDGGRLAGSGGEKAVVRVRIVEDWRGADGVAWRDVRGEQLDGAYGDPPNVLVPSDLDGFVALGAWHDSEWRTTVALFSADTKRAWVVQGKAAVLHDVDAACAGESPRTSQSCVVRVFIEAQSVIIPTIDVRILPAVDAALLARGLTPLQHVTRDAASFELRARATVIRRDVVLKVAGMSLLNFYHFITEGCARIALLRSFLESSLVAAPGSDGSGGGEIGQALREGRWQWLVPDSGHGNHAFIEEALDLLLPATATVGGGGGGGADARAMPLRGNGLLRWEATSAPLIALSGVVAATWTFNASASEHRMQLCQPRVLLLHTRTLFLRALGLSRTMAAPPRRAVVIIQRGGGGGGERRSAVLSRSVSNLGDVARMLAAQLEQRIALGALDEELDVVLWSAAASDRPIREAAELMGRAALIVGVHGAGLTNVLFTTASSKVAMVELSTRSRFHRHFRHMSAALGVSWWAFTDVPPASFDACWQLNPEGVQRLVRTCLAALQSKSVGALREQEQEQEQGQGQGQGQELEPAGSAAAI